MKTINVYNCMYKNSYYVLPIPLSGPRVYYIWPHKISTIFTEVYKNIQKYIFFNIFFKDLVFFHTYEYITKIKT